MIVDEEQADMARPKKDISILWDGWQDDVLQLYKDGASDAEIKALLYDMLGTFSNNLWDRWMEEEEEFWETIKKGRMLAEAWWTKSGRVNLKDREFNYTGWYMNMKNRYGWKDRNDFTSGEDKVRTVMFDFQLPKEEERVEK